MKKVSSGNSSRGSSLQTHLAVGVLIYIVLVLAGSVVLCSCATSEKGVQREADFYEATTNAVALVGQVASNLPPPYGTVFKGVVVGCGILMGVWLTNLEKRIKVIQSGAPPGQSGPALPGPSAPGP